MFEYEYNTPIVATEFNLYEFEPWASGEWAKDIIIEAEKVDEFHELIRNIFYDCPPTEEQINDLLCHDDEYIFDVLDINPYLIEFNLYEFSAEGEASQEVISQIIKYNLEDDFMEFLKEDVNPFSDKDINDFINDNPDYMLDWFNIEPSYIEDFDLDEFETWRETAEVKRVILLNNKANDFFNFILEELDFGFVCSDNDEQVNEFMMDDIYIYENLNINNPYINDFDLNHFETWGEATRIKNSIIKEGKTNQINYHIRRKIESHIEQFPLYDIDKDFINNLIIDFEINK